MNLFLSKAMMWLNKCLNALICWIKSSLILYWRRFYIFPIFSFVIYLIIIIFEAINEVPNRKIYLELYKNGDTDGATCNIDIHTNYDSNSYSDTIDEWTYNVITINHLRHHKSRRLFDKKRFMLYEPLFNENLNAVRKRFPQFEQSVHTVYSLIYQCGSHRWSPGYNISHPDESLPSNALIKSYMTKPEIIEDKFEKAIKGGGKIFFSDIDGSGYFKFRASTDNKPPRFWNFWDVSQSNYDFKISLYGINCNRIAMNFHSPTQFGRLDPQPDTLTSDRIIYVSEDKIIRIEKDGLQFHADFYNTKNMQDVRNFLLTAIMSIVVAFFCSYIIEHIKKHKQ